MDSVNLAEAFKQRVAVMKSVPAFLVCAYRSFMRRILEAARTAKRDGDSVMVLRTWKAFLLLPRMLLHRRKNDAKLPKTELEARFKDFVAGRWIQLLNASTSDRTQTSLSTDNITLEDRAARAVRYVQMGKS